MRNDRIKRLLGLLATLACAVVFAAGCGDDDSGGGNGGDSGPSVGNTSEQKDATGSTDAPDTKDEAIERCYEEAKKLEGQSRETAEASCKAAETGDTDEVKEEAKQQCLDSAKQIPDEAARKQAEDACEKFGQ